MDRIKFNIVLLLYKIQEVFYNLLKMVINPLTLVVTIGFSYFISICVDSWTGYLLGLYLMYRIIYDRKALKVTCKDNLSGIYKLTIGKTYTVINEDKISYRLKNDQEQLDEISKDKFDITEYR